MPDHVCCALIAPDGQPEPSGAAALLAGRVALVAHMDGLRRWPSVLAVPAEFSSR